jgi:Peptidase family M28
VSAPAKTSNLLSEDQLRQRVERWAALDHGSATPGEHAVANMLADELRGLGLRAVRIEEEQVHPGYWWPLGIPTALAALAGLAGRAFGVVAGIAAAKTVADEVTRNRSWLRDRLPKRTTYNVVAELGRADAERTLLLMAHHDAPHTGLVFHPELPRFWARRFPRVLAAANTSAPTMWNAFYGPLAVALGSLFGRRRLRLAGAALSGGFAAAMADIGARGTVPAANDNLSGVAALMSVAGALAAEPPRDLRVVVLLPGSEEALQQGSIAWLARHAEECPPATTTVVNLETVGSPHLLALEGEGMLGVYEYPKDLIGVIKALADELGIYLFPKLRTRNGSDGLTFLRAGYKTATLASVDEFKAPTNYHWPTDVPENVDYTTVADCARLCLALTRALEAGRPA